MLQRYKVAVPWLVALVLLAAGAASGAPQYYVVTDLGTLGSGGSFATAVNSSGVVVGYTYPLGPTPYPAAFAYSGGTIQDLGQGASARAYGIDGPLAVGRNSDEQAFLDDLATGVTDAPDASHYGRRDWGRSRAPLTALTPAGRWWASQRSLPAAAMPACGPSAAVARSRRRISAPWAVVPMASTIAG